MASPQDEDKGWYTLTGDLCEFNLGGETPNRTWFVINKPFGLVRKLFEVYPYDPVEGKGEQRSRTDNKGNPDSHVKKLRRAMVGGNFTPAPWAGGIRKGQLKNLEVDEKKKTVKLRVSERSPLPCLDGGHRESAMEMIRNEAEKAKDVAKMALVDALTITVQVYLDPNFTSRDFRNLQAGKPVSRSQLKFMEEQELASTDPKRSLAKRVAIALDKLPDHESFLSNDVNFLGGGGGKVEYASITATGGSDIATSLAGGAKIALYEGFKQFLPTEEAARDFLVESYKAMWTGIYKYDEKEEFINQMDGQKELMPRLLINGRMLRPNRLGGKGTKGGTGLLIMLGNMLAFRMLAVRKKADIPSTEVIRLIKAAGEVLDSEVRGGGSGTAKRELTGEFVREYFKDAVRQGEMDGHDMRLLGAIEGVPTLLIDILTRSTLNVDKEATEFIPADEVEDESAPTPPTGRLSDPDQTDSTWVESDAIPEDFTPPLPKNGRKKKVAAGAMG
jgi:hypothetical protein